MSCQPLTYANLGGVVIQEDVGDNTFYGFRLNPLTGHLQIEVINSNVSTIQLPFDNVANANDYGQWLWSKLALSFGMQSNGHLLMTTQ